MFKCTLPLLLQVDGADEGKFYSGDCYVILYAYNDGGKDCYLIYFWLVRSHLPEFVMENHV